MRMLAGCTGLVVGTMLVRNQLTALGLGHFPSQPENPAFWEPRANEDLESDSDSAMA